VAQASEDQPETSITGLVVSSATSATHSPSSMMSVLAFSEADDEVKVILNNVETVAMMSNKKIDPKRIRLCFPARVMRLRHHESVFICGTMADEIDLPATSAQPKIFMDGHSLSALFRFRVRSLPDPTSSLPSLAMHN
ncbi:hypothetical protein BGZ47_001405, partial [Haplosporangium gracile]